MKKHLVLVTLVAVMFAGSTAFARRCGSACATSACAKPVCAPKKACVDTICTKEIVNVPATQEVIRKVTTETSVGPIMCESCNCEEQHRPVSPDGGYAK